MASVSIDILWLMVDIMSNAAMSNECIQISPIGNFSMYLLTANNTLTTKVADGGAEILSRFVSQWYQR